MDKPLCNNCGYDLSGLPYVANYIDCPECGRSNPRPLLDTPIIPANVWKPSLIVLAASLLFSLGVFALAWTNNDRFIMLLAWLSAPAFGVLNWIVTTTSWIMNIRRIRRSHGAKAVAGYVAIGLLVGIATALIVGFLGFVLFGLSPPGSNTFMGV